MELFVFTFEYILVCVLCFGCMTWMVVKVLRDDPHTSDNNDGSGGVPVDFVFPVFDPPGGNSLDDLLVDRLPKDMQEEPHHELEIG